MGRLQCAGSLDDLNLVLAHQHTNALDQALGYLSAAIHGGAIVGLKAIDRESKFLALPQQRDDLGIAQQGFGGDATPIQAHATQVFPFDQRNL